MTGYGVWPPHLFHIRQPWLINPNHFLFLIIIHFTHSSMPIIHIHNDPLPPRIIIPTLCTFFTNPFYSVFIVPTLYIQYLGVQLMWIVIHSLLWNGEVSNYQDIGLSLLSPGKTRISYLTWYCYQYS